MTWLTLGSLALPFQLNRGALTLRDDMTRLSVELTTGASAQPQRLLRGDLGPLTAVETRLSRLAAYTQTGKEAGSAADIAQSVLSRLADSGSNIASRMLLVSNDGIAPETLRSGANAARSALDDLSSALGQRVAGRAVFSGTQSDRPPLPDAETILATIVPSLAGLPSTDDIVAAVTSAFLDPGGLFETALYLGGPPADGAALDTRTNAPSLPTAADPGLRRLMAGLVISALAGSDAMPLSDKQRQAMARAGAEALMGSAPAMAEAQASLGETQAMLDATQTRLTGERDALVMARQSLIGADPYEAAGQLQVVQTRLEVLYAVTARTARMSLTGYL
ncbi:MAG: flagellin [Pararhodobacter sp.]